MTTITIKENIVLNKKVYNNTKELWLVINFFNFKRNNKLDTKDIIKKYGLNKVEANKSLDIVSEIDKIAYWL